MVANLLARFVSATASEAELIVLLLLLLTVLFLVIMVVFVVRGTLEPVFGVALFKWRFVAGGVRGLVQSVCKKKREKKSDHISQMF